MFVTIRCSNAPVTRFRLETHAEASLLELCCQTAEQLGALCPPTGFQLSMNNQDALGDSSCYLTSLKDLGVRHADVLYVLNGFANPCALFAAVHRLLDLTKPPATGSVSTQTVSQGVCSGTQTPGRPFPSDTGTQTDFQDNDLGYAVSTDPEDNGPSSTQSPVLSTCPAFNTDAQTERSEELSLLLQHSGPPCGQVPDRNSESMGANGNSSLPSNVDLDSGAAWSDDDYDGSSPSSLDIFDGGTTFLPSTQTPSSQQLSADTKRCTMTPPLSLSHDCGDQRKRLRSSQCHTER